MMGFKIKGALSHEGKQGIAIGQLKLRPTSRFVRHLYTKPEYYYYDHKREVKVLNARIPKPEHQLQESSYFFSGRSPSFSTSANGWD
jgi:hypothetical protein